MKSHYYYIPDPASYWGTCTTDLPLLITCAGTTGNFEGISRLTRTDYHLIYIQNNSYSIKTDKTYRMKVGDMFIVPPNTHHIQTTDEGNPITYLTLHFMGNDAQSILEHFKIPVNVPFTPGIHHKLTDDFQRLFDAFITGGEYLNDVACAIFTELLADVSGYIHPKINRHIFAKSINFINEKYFIDFKIKDLAQIEGLSESRYRTLFKEFIGTTPTEYINKKRLEVSLALLENLNNTILEVALFSGFNSVYYFIKVFKKYNKITPSQYRKKYLDKNN